MAKRHRKTYRKKSNAQKHAPSGSSVYHTKQGWRVSRKHKKSSRRRRRSWP